MTESKPLGSLNDEIERTLLMNRRLFFSRDFNMESAADAIRKIWYLESTAPGKGITLVINSPGGSVDAGFAIWDQIKMITSPVTTLVTGLAASMGSVLSLVGGKGRRLATPNSRILIHQPSLGAVVHGQATDLEIEAREILRTRSRIIDLYVEATGKDRNAIGLAIERDTWFSPQEAKEFGLIDRIVTSYSEIS